MSEKASWSRRWLRRLHLLRAFLWSWLRRPERALRAFEAVDALGGLEPPWGTAVLALRGRILDVLGRKEEAEAALVAAVALEPRSPEPHRAYAEMLMGWGRLEDAGRELRLAKELGPPDARLELALAQYAERTRGKGPA